jgi:Zn-dependent protease
VGMVGPITNLAIAIIAALTFNALSPSGGTTLYEIFKYTISLNVGLFVFNSIPWPPLDGSRLLYAFAPRAIQEFMESIERVGLWGLILFIFLFYQLGAPIGTVIQHLVNILAPSLVV